MPELRTYDRLIPAGGLELQNFDAGTTYNIKHVDGNDIDTIVRSDIENRLYNEPATPEFMEHRQIDKGTIFGKQHLVYSYVDGNFVLYARYLEILDSPHGYGEKDFLSERWVHPDYRGTKFVRMLATELASILFLSGVANHVYGFMKTEKTDKSLPESSLNTCSFYNLGKDEHPSLVFVQVPKLISTDAGWFAVVELDGGAFRALSLKNFIYEFYGYDLETVNKRYDSIMSAVGKVKA